MNTTRTNWLDGAGFGRRSIHLTAAIIVAMVLVAAVPATATASVANGEEQLVTSSSAYPLAYAADNDIWVLAAGSSAAINLTHSPEVREWLPEWSPDGERIAYMASDLSEGADPGIWVQSVEGAQSPQALCGSADFSCGDPSWSPDGSTIAFTGVVSGARSGIWTTPADGTGEPSLLVSVGGADLIEPDWSPSGNQLAIGVSGTQQHGIGVVNKEGNGLEMRTDRLLDAEPSWSPDGTKIAFSRSDWYNSDIWVVDAGGGNVRPLSARTDYKDESPAWDPTGATVLFGSRQFGTFDSDIYAVSADGSGHLQPVVAGEMSESDPAVALPAPDPDPCIQQTIEILGRAIEATGCFARDREAWVATGSVRVNGIDLTTEGTVTLDPEAARLTVDAQVTVSVDDVTLLVAGGIDWTLQGEVHLSLGQNFTLKGFPIEGEATIGWSAGEVNLELSVKLPQVLGGFSAKATLSANNRDGIKLEKMSVSVERASIAGRLELKDLVVAYTAADDADAGDKWEGQATVVLPTPYSVEVTAKLTLVDGQFSSGSVDVTGIGRHIANGIFLESIGFSVGTEPLVLTGTAGLTAGPVIDGHSAAKLVGSLSYTFADPDVIKVSGNLTIADDIQLAEGSMEYRSTGRLSVDGHLGFEKLGVGVAGDIEGWIDGADAFNIEGGVVVDADLFEIGGHAIVSSVGMAACGTLETWLGDVSLGVGYKWHQNPEYLSGCDLGPYRQDGLQFADGAGDFVVTDGLPVAALALTGEQDPPMVTLVDPNGRRLDMPADDGVTPEGNLVVTNPADRTTYIALVRPVPGRWQIEVDPHSSPVASVRQSDGLPKPVIDADVTPVPRTDGEFELAWDVQPIPGQTVTFAEVSVDGARVVATADQSVGSITFAGGSEAGGKRTMTAIVTQDGLPRANVALVTY